MSVPTLSLPRRRTTRRRHRRVTVGLTLLVLLALIALAAPLLAPHDPETIDAANVLGGPSATHLFGLDALGRDVLSRVLYAYRVSLAVSIGSVLLALAIGVPIGLFAGYRGGWPDAVAMRGIDLLLALPALLLAISLVTVLSPGTLSMLVAIAVIWTPIIARVTRASVRIVREEPYVLAARARGVRPIAVAVRHVLPNAIGPTLVQASVLMGFSLQVEAALSFLGLGAQPPTPSLGLMLADGYQVLQQQPWADILPGLAIAVTVIAFNVLGDGLRARFDAREER